MIYLKHQVFRRKGHVVDDDRVFVELVNGKARILQIQVNALDASNIEGARDESLQNGIAFFVVVCH